MNEQVTYPQFFFILFGIIGFIFIIKKPQYNFWLGIFYFSARELRAAVFTRLEAFGPYLNLDDFIILILIISLVRFSFRKKIKIPVPVIWLGICFISSIFIIGLNYGAFTYEVQREHKAALYFILAFFLSYNFFTNEKEFEYFLKLLFIGSIVASIQYIFFTQEKISFYGSGSFYESIRSVGFIGLIPSLIILSFFLKIQWLASPIEKFIFLIGLSLMIINLILSQTRSYYISIALTVFIIFLINREMKFKSSFLVIAFLPFIIYIVFDQYLSLLNINDLIFGRTQLLFDNPSTDPTTIGRMAAMQYEFAAFLSSNIFFGNGLGFIYFLPESNNPNIAWGHIGHIAYLARLGLLGFIIYSIYLPYRSLAYLLKTKPNVIKYNYIKIFFLFATGLIISDWIQFWMSSSYLGLTAFLPGTVFGIIWALKDKRIKLTKYSIKNLKNAIPEN